MPPMGVDVCDVAKGDSAKTVLVSTIRMDGAHLEDPLGICGPEYGYETMVFLNGSSLLSVYAQQYKTRQEAQRGHEAAVEQLMARVLPLSLPIHYCCFAGADE